MTSITGGGGEHRIFAYPDFTVRKDSTGKLLGAGVDVLSDGCIIVAPPSRHASGNRYRWEEGKSFRDLRPAPLPEPWLDRLRGNTAARRDADNAPAQNQRHVPEGRRNTYLTSLAGTLQRWGFARDHHVGVDGGKRRQMHTAARHHRGRENRRQRLQISRPPSLAMVPTPPKL